MTRPLIPVDREDFDKLVERVAFLEDEMQRITECRNCFGSGSVFDDECEICKGSGQNPATAQT